MKRLFGLLGFAGALLLALGSAAPAGDPFLRCLALEYSRSLADGELAVYLASNDQRLAARAALAIGRTKRSAGAALLLAHVSDARAPVRAMSVYGLGLILAPDAQPQIVAASRDSSGAVRVAALDAIARLAAAGKLDPGRVIFTERAVAAVLRQDRDPLVRARAATALASFGTSSAGAAAADVLVVAFQRDGDVRVRRNAMWAIFRSYAIRVPRAVLTSGLHDSDEIVRIEAVRAYGRLKNADAVAALRPLLNDPSWRVAEQTAESIRALQGKPPTDHWSAIPANVQLPPIPPDALASLPALPRNAPAAKPVAPVPSQAILQPQIDPRTAADMNGPAPGSHPRVRIVTTKGNVYVTLFPEWAPMTVANFLNVADHGYYDNNRWFRIVPDFVVQTGDPNDNGEGDAGFSLGAEENPLEQQSYVISMGLNYDGNAPIRDSAGTQFYVTLSPQLHLNRDFTVFGVVSGGEAVLAHLVESDRIVRVERIADVTL